MSLLSIVAKFSCDECGSQFNASVDESYEPPPGWAMFDVAVDAIRSSLWESVDNDKHLCRVCTEKADIAAESSADSGEPR